eukprot:jgi/Bigna1/137449/aug1.39_g12157
MGGSERRDMTTKGGRGGGPFRLKKFQVLHDRCAHKVGADGILLGAWMVSVLKFAGITPTRVLDIGTGCGLLALMAAQEFPSAKVDAVEADALSFFQAQDNFEKSAFSPRLRGFHTRIQDFAGAAADTRFEAVSQVQPNALVFLISGSYDVIVSNPPFFFNDGYASGGAHLRGEDDSIIASSSPMQTSTASAHDSSGFSVSTRRAVARHANLGLPLNDLFESVARHLKPPPIRSSPCQAEQPRAARQTAKKNERKETFSNQKQQHPLFFTVFPSSSEMQVLAAARKALLTPAYALRSCNANSGQPRRTLVAFCSHVRGQNRYPQASRRLGNHGAETASAGLTPFDNNARNNNEDKESDELAASMHNAVDHQIDMSTERAPTDARRRAEDRTEMPKARRPRDPMDIVRGPGGGVVPSICIRNRDGTYTEEYIALTKDFHEKDLRNSQ